MDVEAVRRLNEDGVPSMLHIMGIRDLSPQVAGLPYINYIGSLNKNVSGEYQKLVKTIRSCRLFLLPTRAECAGVAFCEASAYGMPVFTYDTDGIPNYVLNGYRLSPPGSNGQRLRPEDRKLPCNRRTGKDVGNSLRNISYQTELESVSQRVAVDN